MDLKVFTKWSLLLIVVICAFTACKKTGITPGLFGKWELRRSSGGFAYFDSTYTAGNGNVYQFNRDSTYKQFINNKLNAQGIFHIIIVIYGGSKSSGIVFDNNENFDYLDFEGTKLTIGRSDNHGVASNYQKVSN